MSSGLYMGICVMWHGTRFVPIAGPHTYLYHSSPGRRKFSCLQFSYVFLLQVQTFPVCMFPSSQYLFLWHLHIIVRWLCRMPFACGKAWLVSKTSFFTICGYRHHSSHFSMRLLCSTYNYSFVHIALIPHFSLFLRHWIMICASIARFSPM